MAYIIAVFHRNINEKRLPGKDIGKIPIEAGYYFSLQER
ncbi:hypothetical protein BAXH7_03163 [Bacillus amyloliquefaciens XH7]|nr:hypothetical protein LL3_03183 [Bacillus amyloliquefaciens LL3]AEK90283.1 hypothetical protein BAXH7_03163 [Bacillus amyloliquefaciens XH7]KYC99502.1 hypothetical protein B425_3987 [Bacillus amyloliquefaciens]QBG57550.1 hypothetical protein D2M30_3249 [Bacillus amyloliquefaciens]